MPIGLSALEVNFHEYPTEPLDRKIAQQAAIKYAGWEILALDHLLAGIFVQRLASQKLI